MHEQNEKFDKKTVTIRKKKKQQQTETLQLKNTITELKNRVLKVELTMQKKESATWRL